MGTATAEFQLTDAERAVGGLEYDDSELRVRPTRRASVGSGLTSAFLMGFGVWLVADPYRIPIGDHAVRNPEAVVTLAVVLMLLGVSAACDAFRPFARADAVGVGVRRFIRSRRYTWAQVAEVRVDVRRVDRRDASVEAGPGWLPWRRRPFEARGVLQLSSGEVVVLSDLIGRLSSPTLPSDHPTTLKVAALARLRETHVGPPVPVAVTKQRDRIWPPLLGVAGFGVVSSWAAGRPDVDPFLVLLAIGLVGNHWWSDSGRSTD